MADDFESALNRVYREILNVREAVDSQIGLVRSDIAEFRSESLSNFDAAAKRFDRLESEYAFIVSAVRRIEVAIGSKDLEPAVSIQEQIRDLRKKVADLQRRLDELESAT